MKTQTYRNIAYAVIFAGIATIETCVASSSDEAPTTITKDHIEELITGNKTINEFENKEELKQAINKEIGHIQGIITRTQAEKEEAATESREYERRLDARDQTIESYVRHARKVGTQIAQQYADLASIRMRTSRLKRYLRENSATIGIEDYKQKQNELKNAWLAQCYLEKSIEVAEREVKPYPRLVKIEQNNFAKDKSKKEELERLIADQEQVIAEKTHKILKLAHILEQIDRELSTPDQTGEGSTEE